MMLELAGDTLLIECGVECKHSVAEVLDFPKLLCQGDEGVDSRAL
jgi:hypothetical protein